MRLSVVIIYILLSVICVLLALLQYYYSNYKRLISIKYDIPTFDDFIPTDREGDNALGYLQLEWKDEFLGNVKSVINSYFYDEPDRITLYDAGITDKASDSEAFNSLQAALQFKSSGKKEKAKKLFQHAVAMAPNNPDVLNRYGEFLEQMDEDVVMADQLYTRALAYSPQHQLALSNRKRTAPVVDRIDLKMFKSIDSKRNFLKDRLDVAESFDAIKREAYYLHIYHTVSIEGNTLSLEDMRYILETGRAVAGKSIAEHNEILGLEIAMKYVKLITRVEFIGIKEILGIHRRIMGHVDPLRSGIFRDQQVYVGSHVPPAPDKVPILMREFVEWLNSEEAQSMHPVRYAALAHLKLVDIHPFSDGNGRTSRLLMNLILIKAGYPPVIIMKQHRTEYYNCLDVAHKGDVRPFVRFIVQCTDEIMDMYLEGIDKLSLAGSPHYQVISMEENNNKT